MNRNRIRIVVFGLILSLMPVAIVAGPAAAWHVIETNCVSKPVGEIFGPYGDPQHYAWVRYPLNCEGTVTVPDESWVQDGTFSVHPEGNLGRILGQGQRGDTIHGLKSDRCYDGTWSNSNEVEHFCIQNTSQAHRFTFRTFKPNGDVRRDRVTMRPGCRWITPLRNVKELTMMSLQDNTAKRTLDKERSGRNAYWSTAPKKNYGSVYCWS